MKSTVQSQAQSKSQSKAQPKSQSTNPPLQVSQVAAQIQTSPILQIAAEIDARKRQGEALHNLTVGDFAPEIFAPPDALCARITAAYRAKQTNYPGAPGVAELRASVAAWHNRAFDLDIDADEVLIAGGSRPLIYALYRAAVNRGEKVVYPVPSWNNEDYAKLVGATIVPTPTTPQNHFMPTAESLSEHLRDAALLALCAPQNPTGTMFNVDNLRAVCQLVVDENRRRGRAQKPLYVLFDQVYWALAFGDGFNHPLAVCPQLRPYAVFIDGISKCFAATGVRVGFGVAPPALREKMIALIAHIGAWAPKPEQIAVGEFLAQAESVDEYLRDFRAQLSARLERFYRAIIALRDDGYPLDAIAPQAAIYLSVRMQLQGRNSRRGALADDDAVQRYLLDDAHIGVLPFSWFGAHAHGDWFRLSIGACRQDDIDAIVGDLKRALDDLQ